MPTQKHFTISETAAKLGISRQAVHEAIKKGSLKAKRRKIIQSVWFVAENALKAYRVSLSHKKRAQKSR